ncbi:hypothetical protein QBC44DRAFT_126342 [Cladorrhinum sp. PSN332]|nr:hypothetical protein QBC44DRAFT_126342 [Cladorrhinum sp. PSN332]
MAQPVSVQKGACTTPSPSRSWSWVQCAKSVQVFGDNQKARQAATLAPGFVAPPFTVGEVSQVCPFQPRQDHFVSQLQAGAFLFNPTSGSVARAPSPSLHVLQAACGTFFYVRQRGADAGAEQLSQSCFYAGGCRGGCRRISATAEWERLISPGYRDLTCKQNGCNKVFHHHLFSSRTRRLLYQFCNTVPTSSHQRPSTGVTV